MGEKVLLLLAEGFEEIEAISVVDILRRAEIPVVVAAVGDSLEVEGGHGIVVLADTLLKEVDPEEFSLVVLPGGRKGVENMEKDPYVKKILESFSSKGKNIAAICAAPSLLAKRGLLKGKKATSYPSFQEILEKEGAKVEKTLPVVEEEKIITSQGPATAMEFALYLVEKLKGEKIKKDLAERLLYAS